MAARRWFRRHPRLAVAAIVVVLTLALDIATATALRACGVVLLAPPDTLYRTAHPVYHHGLLPNVSCEAAWGSLRYPMYTNSLGFRDAAPREVPLEPTGRRILLMGDSFTEGIGVPYEQSFAGVLAAALAAEDCEVLNGAAVSYAPSIYLYKTRYLVDEVGLRFDRLVVCLDLSDIEDEAKSYRAETARVAGQSTRSTAEVLKDLVRDHTLLLYLGRLTVHRLKHGGSHYVDTDWRASLGRERVLWTLEPKLMAAWGDVGLARATERMTELRAYLREKGIPLTLVVYPWPDQIVRHDRDSLQVRHWASWCAAEGVAFVNCFPAFCDDPRGAEAVIRESFIPGDTHFNAAGHKVMARELLRALRGG